LSIDTSRALICRTTATSLLSTRYATGGDIALSIGANVVLQAITDSTMRGHAPAIFATPACPARQICTIVGLRAGAQVVFYTLPLARTITLFAGSGNTLTCGIANASGGVPVPGTIHDNGRIGLAATLMGVLLASATF